MRAPGDPAVKRFIARSSAVRIATLSPKGNPDLIPLWFVAYRGHIYMAPRAGNPVVRDLRANPEVVLLFHGERRRHADRVLRLRGRAVFRTEKEIIRPVGVRMATRYYLSAGGAWNTLRNLRRLPLVGRYRRERAEEVGVIEVTPVSAEFLRLP